jgi:hypothetical protein
MADTTNSFVKANNTWTQSIAWAKVDPDDQGVNIFFVTAT